MQTTFLALSLSVRLIKSFKKKKESGTDELITLSNEINRGAVIIYPDYRRVCTRRNPAWVCVCVGWGGDAVHLREDPRVRY